MADGADLEELLGAFADLVARHEASAAPDAETGDDQNFRCADCSDCASCRFCTACERCVECTYCDACIDCEGCTQSRECMGCAMVKQSTHSAYCEESSYLTLCLDCDNCVQCFGCVGLSGEEFHILNKKYHRGEYFKKVNELRAALDAKTLEGWFPPWADIVAGTPAPAQAAASAGQTAAPPGPNASPAGEIHEAKAAAGVPKAIQETASDYTGSWPPEDHASARALDQHRGADEAWNELEAEGSKAFRTSQSPASKPAEAPASAEPGRSAASAPQKPPAPPASTPDPSRFAERPPPSPSRFSADPRPASAPRSPAPSPMGAGLLPDDLVGEPTVSSRFDAELFPTPPARTNPPNRHPRPPSEPSARPRPPRAAPTDGPSLRSATRPTRPAPSDK